MLQCTQKKGGAGLEYLSVRQAMEKWHMTDRRVTALCREGRIPGAKKTGKTWLIPDDAEMPLDGRTRAYAQKGSRGEGPTGEAAYTASGAGEKARQRFIELYGKEPEGSAFTPYHLCPVGAHCDHQQGVITGLVIDKGIHMVYGPKHNGVIELASLQFPKRAQWHVNVTPEEKQNDWADHLRGACIALGRRYPLRVGLCAIINGELPIGGLSSSAATILTFLSALSRLNGIRLKPEELIAIAREAEGRYVESANGSLGQVCEIYCRKDKLLKMDLLDGQRELIEYPKTGEPFEILLFFSGLSKSLASRSYNRRVDECRAAAYALLAFAGENRQSLRETSMRLVPRELFDGYRDRLPADWARRAEHWYTEQARCEEAAEAWRRGDMRRFGALCTESGLSSVENWQTGAPELHTLFDIVTHTAGVYGGRYAGAGFKGCVMAFAEPGKREEILQKVETAFLAACPELREKYSAHVCRSADGVHLE